MAKLDAMLNHARKRLNQRTNKPIAKHATETYNKQMDCPMTSLPQDGRRKRKMARRDLSEKVHRYNKNNFGKTLIVGDLHGMRTAMEHALSLIGFDTSKDVLYATGDLIDRGSENFETLDLIYEDWFRSVRGNHDEMMIQTQLNCCNDHKRTWIGNGGMWMLTESPMKLGDYARDMKKKMPLVIVVGDGAERFNIVHAEIVKREIINGHHERIQVTNQMIDEWGFTTYDEETMMWGRIMSSQIENEMLPVYTRCHHPDDMSPTYVGHTPMDRPVQIEKQIYIDGGGVFQECPNRWLTNDKNNLTFADPYAKVFYIYSVITKTILELPYTDMRQYFQ